MAIAKKKKKFIDVPIHIIGKETQLLAYSTAELDKKFIKYDLSRILRGKNAEIVLVVKVDGEKITTSPKKFRLMPYFIRRMIRKGTNYVEDSFLAECKNAQLRIKPFLITRKKVHRSVRKELRRKAKEDPDRPRCRAAGLHRGLRSGHQRCHPCPATGPGDRPPEAGPPHGRRGESVFHDRVAGPEVSVCDPREDLWRQGAGAGRRLRH